MTAIIGFLKNGQGALLGDALVSKPMSNGLPPVYVPTVGLIEPQNFQLDGYQPAGLGQKISIIAPNVAIAWSGRQIIARAIIVDLRLKTAIKVFNQADMVQWMDTDLQEIDPKREASIIGLLTDAGRDLLFSREATRYETDTFGYVHVAGTGEGQLLMRILSEEPPITTGMLHPVFFALHLLADLIADEVHNADSLKLLFGGNYEIAVRTEEGFQKLPDVVIVLWLAMHDGTSLLLKFPYRIIKNVYVDDLLITRSLIFNDGSGDITSDKSNVIPPIDKPYPSSSEQAKIIATSLHSHRFVHFFYARRKSGSIFSLTRIDQHSNDGISLNEHDGKVTLEVPREFVDAVLAQMQQEYDEG